MHRSAEPSAFACHAPTNAKRRAASLVELIVVIAVIAFMVAMLIPSLNRSFKLASATICRHNLREIGHSLALYRVDNDGWLPASLLENDTELLNDNDKVWFLKLYPTYLSDLSILSCPEDPFGKRMVRARDRVDDPFIADYPSYGINSFIMTAGAGFLSNLDHHRLTRPLDTILVADLGPDRDFSPSSGGGPARNKSLLAWDDGFDAFADQLSGPWITARHGRGINILTVGTGVREAHTLQIMQEPIRPYYPSCAAGGCILCNDLELDHYSFARDRLYWWTGSASVEK